MCTGQKAVVIPSLFGPTPWVLRLLSSGLCSCLSNPDMLGRIDIPSFLLVPPFGFCACLGSSIHPDCLVSGRYLCIPRQRAPSNFIELKHEVDSSWTDVGRTESANEVRSTIGGHNDNEMGKHSAMYVIEELIPGCFVKNLSREILVRQNSTGM